MEPFSPGEFMHSGFACFVGRPNTGKSTLLNAIIGQKIAITSSKPQTTRRAIRGIITTDTAQLIIVDTPGLHRPRTLLGERLNHEVHETLASVDVIAICLPANEAIGPGDRFIAGQLPKHVPILALLTKTDTVSRDEVARRLVDISEFGRDVGIDWVDIVPVSAKDGANVQTVLDCLTAKLPEGPVLYPDGEMTDEPVDIAIAERIREAALDGVQDELPHSIAVVVEEIEPRESGTLTDVRAKIYVERDSQKAIVIGKGGSRLKQVGTRSRKEIEQILGTKVFLHLHVAVAKDWQRDPKQLRKLGF
jgi:GTP-binding protein Era